MSGKNNVQEKNDISPGVSAWGDDMDDSHNEDLLLLNDEINLNTSLLRTDEKYVGFDNNVGENWIYPSNFPERAYQYNIVQKALFHNTLVVLPTGLGKTFIAAVVMYNIYRWYPMGKVIFMAPTRPLVAQQIDACRKIMGIPKSDSVEITGKLSKASRGQLWQSKRIFFATPQSVQSDIFDAELNFPFEAVKLIVVDEAHRAKGRYAYTEVIRYIWSKNKFFRILALSATPGRRKEDVEEVIRNLFISSLEVRAEDSVDVVSYVHKRQLKVVVVNLGSNLTKIRDELLEIADPHIRNLIENRLISGRPASISRNWLVMEQKRFREMTLNSGVPYQKELNSDFTICISVYHAIELLERHGLRVFLNNFDESQESGPKFVVILRPDLRRLVQRVREEAGPNPFSFSDQCMLDGQIAPIPHNIDFGHPKFEIAREHVLAHFESNKDSRVIIFCEYRESVMLMHRVLLQHRPLIRPRLFVGQGGTGSIRAVTQNQQINVMNDFKSGKSNVLIATSVAEEGIDVGEVDLIVCFDINTSNPTRFIQRIGRTGRQKEGKVLLLATEGKEHSILKDVLSERNRLNKSISRSDQFKSAFYNYAPRMVPTEFNPKCLKLFIQAPQIQEPESKIKKSKTTKENKFAQICQKKDLRHFFKQKTVLDDEAKAIFADSETPKRQLTIKSASKNRSTTETDFPLPRNSPDVTNEILPIETATPDSTSIGINNKMMKKMAKYIRNSANAQPIETLKAIGSNKLSKDSLQFQLEFSPNVLPDIWTRMQELWQKGIDENNIPLKGVTYEDRLIIRAYLQIVNSVGSKETIAELVEHKQKLPITPSFSSLNEKYKTVFGDLEDGGIFQNNTQFLVEKYDEISSEFVGEVFPKDSYVRSMVYDDVIDEIDENASIFDQSSRNYSNDYVMDSKYMSQWDDTPNHTIDNSFEPPTRLNTELSASKDKESLKVTSKTLPAAEDSDDDVVFVGTTHQSTPIRTGQPKQSLLNFTETPIISSASKRISQRIPRANKNQKNILDFMKTKKVQNIEAVSHQTEAAQNISKSLEKECENTMNFFDDQFDDLIAANSGILERIESSNQVNKSSDKPAGESRPSTSENPPSNTFLQEKQKVPVNLSKSHLSNESIPDVNSMVDSKEDQLYNKTPSIRNMDTADPHSSAVCCKDQSNIKPESEILENIHPELADIDINELSEFSLEDIVGSVKSNSPPQSPVLPHRTSPDIFDELSESIPDLKFKEKSPIKLITCPPPQVSPCLVTKKPLTWREIRQKYIKSSQAQPSEANATNSRNDGEVKIDVTLGNKPDESVINVGTKIRSKRRIIISESDSSDDNNYSLSRKKPKPQLPANQELGLKRKRTNEFIDDEAVLSGSATDDEFEHTIGRYIQDSVVVDDDEAENESSIPMTGMYLQSVRSPCGNMRGRFKIPDRRHYNDASKIFSQREPADNGSYVKDSFVVVSDEECDDDEEKSMCPLERAEEILRLKRRARRRAKQCDVEGKFLQPAKKKRVFRIHNSSEDDDDFV